MLGSSNPCFFLDMVNIATFNVRRLANGDKCNKIFKYIKSKFYDIVFLQETHSTKKIEKLWKSHWGGKILFSNGKPNAKGCAILI